MPVKRVSLRPSAARTTALPNSVAQTNPMKTKGRIAMPITLTTSTSISTGTRITAMIDATID